MIYLILFILGSIFGSFLSLIINRTIREESIVHPPSHCESCNHRLYPYDLIPILSFIFLKGKCRYCKSKIATETFFTELITGLIFILTYDGANIIQSILLALGLSLAMVIAAIDFKTYDIYMYQILILSIFGLVYRYIYLSFDIKFFKKILIFTIIYGIIYILSQGGLGNGDIYYYLSTFLFIANDLIVWSVLFSIWMGAIFGIVIAIKNKSMKIEIPFCIYIFAGFMIVSINNGAVL